MNLNIKDQLPLPPALAKLDQTFSVIQRISFPVSSAGIPPERSLGVHRDIPKREERVVCDYIRRNPPSPTSTSTATLKRRETLGNTLVVSIHIKRSSR